MIMIKRCETCRKLFVDYSVYLTKEKQHFCCWECFKEYRGY
nr:MAG TPA: zinc-ribbon domain protein [Caudoviricetes sp.]